jgi:uncharacterized RDD family membrane protein YckC
MTAVGAVNKAKVVSSRGKQESRRQRAAFSLRCGALLIDYVLLISIVACSTLIARMLGGGARTAGGSAETFGILIAVFAAALDLGVLPGFTGRTLGKWATGLRIERSDGAEIGVGRAMIRHFIGYPVSFLLLGLGFLLGAFTPRGRTLHDFICGTVVVREASSLAAVRSAEPR